MKHYPSDSPFETLCGHDYDVDHDEIEEGEDPDCVACHERLAEHMQADADKMESYVHPKHKDWELYHQLCVLTPPKKWPFPGAGRSGGR